jgi:hypothetical protein
MMISSYINLPFGRWAYCQFPAIVEANSVCGKIKSGSDLLIWIGQLELVIARDASKAKAWSIQTQLQRLARLLQSLWPATDSGQLAPQQVTRQSAANTE